MSRFITYALPLLILLLALFGFTVEIFDAEPRPGSVLRLTLSGTTQVPAGVVLGSWIMEACGLLALYLLARGRFGTWWLDGLLAGSLAWVFRGPLLVMTLTVAVRQPQGPWWTLAFGWWVLYCICGLALALLARNLLDGSQDEDSSQEDTHPVENDPIEIQEVASASPKPSVAVVEVETSQALEDSESSDEEEAPRETPSVAPEMNEVESSSAENGEAEIDPTTENKGH